MALVNSSRETLDENEQPVLIEGDLPDYAFDAEGWSIDFGEVQQPLTEQEKDVIFEKRRQLGLVSTIDEIKNRNPDIKTDEEAEAILKNNIKAETRRVIMMKSLMAASGSLGASTENIAADGSPSFETNRGTPQPQQPDAPKRN
jgi:hypothetical protein